MNKKELAILEKAYEAEIDGALRGYEGILQTKSKAAKKLADEGYLEEVTIRLGGQFPVVSVGYRLTIFGNLTYLWLS